MKKRTFCSDDSRIVWSGRRSSAQNSQPNADFSPRTGYDHLASRGSGSLGEIAILSGSDGEFRGNTRARIESNPKMNAWRSQDLTESIQELRETIERSQQIRAECLRFRIFARASLRSEVRTTFATREAVPFWWFRPRD
jgi:hypothetical protein